MNVLCIPWQRETTFVSFAIDKCSWLHTSMFMITKHHPSHVSCSLVLVVSIKKNAAVVQYHHSYGEWQL